MVFAEAIKFDTGEVVLILLALAAWVLGSAIVLGGIGMALGIAVARLRQSKAEVAALDRGNLLGLWVTAAALALGSLMVLVFALPSSWRRPYAVGMALPAPAIWGWWNARFRRYSGPPSAPPPWPPPPSVDDNR